MVELVVTIVCLGRVKGDSSMIGDKQTNMTGFAHPKLTQLLSHIYTEQQLFLPNARFSLFLEGNVRHLNVIIQNQGQK